MVMDYLGMDLELKTVSTPQRLIVGHAAHHSSIDRVRDIIDPAASEKAVKRLGRPAEVAALIGHDATQLPVGIPQKIEATPHGLYTETYILKGPVGDNLLAVAKDLLDHGQTLGMSIGYKTRDSRVEQTAHGRIRRILDYELREFSWAPAQAIANPSALVAAVKSRRKEPELSVKGAGMQYRVEHDLQTDRWLVYADTDGDGDADDNVLVGSYASQETANAVATALRLQQRADDGDDAEDGEGAGAADTGKTLSLLQRPMTKEDFDRLSDSEKMALHSELLEAGAV